jgi:hypothetical protein
MTSNGVFDFFFANYSGGGSQPGINAVVDVGNDQGRLVRIDFNRTGRDDALSSTPVISYEAYRRNDSPPAFVTGQQMTPGQLLLGGWTQVGSVGAHGEDHYSINVPTVGDSTLALGQYLSVFYIRASTSTPTTLYDSAPDSGYSVDNLAPGVPASFVFDAGSLTWNESTAPDFDYFTVYGSNVDSFANATLVNYTTGRIMNVTGSPYTFYYVTVTDFSGNEGRPAKVNTLSGIGGTPQSYVLSVSNYPNPFNPRTTVKYTVPGHARVSVRVFDSTGAYVATLFEGERKAGAYSVEWDGHAASGATVGSGIYFARIEQNGATRTAKMVLLK